MRHRIESQIPRSLRRLQRLDDVVRVGAVLMNDRQRAVGGGSKRVTGARVEPGAVNARSDRCCSDDLP